ncbi:MAG: carboxymuconolactone decarboxylase family protein [Myxococcota bacterium]
MDALETLRQQLPSEAKDLKLNLQSVLTGGSLDEETRWGVALASALTTRQPALIDAVRQDASVSDEVRSDAEAAAALMGMNNVYYRFRHFVSEAGSPDYELPARLRMNRMARPNDKRSFELFCLAASAITGCELCVTSHEKVVRAAGLTAEQIHDAVRIAATLHGIAIALDSGGAS